MEDIRPTAKWANRMLRPLTSIYHRLEKHHEIVTSVLISKAKERTDAVPDVEQRTRLPTKTQGTERGCSYPDDDEEPNDPAWIPGKPMDKRRIRHNYSSRGRGAAAGPRRRSRLLIRSPEVPKTLPGAIEIATPLITGKLRGSPLVEASPSLRMQLFQNHLADNGVGSSAEHRKTGRTNHSAFRPYQGSWKEVLDQSGDPGLVDIAHLLDRIFLKFLGNTRVAPQVDGAQRGARSLLSMAVRRLPEFIANEQRIQDELDEDCDVDMCDAYFTELEASYAPGELGWQPLREAVRAQGIYLVSGMIENRWITSIAACRLLEECLKHQELDAFEALETKLLASIDTYHHPSAFDPPRPPGQRDSIRLLGLYYLRHPTRHVYVFQQLTRLLTRGAIPPEWMVTTLWKKCVDKAIKSVSTEDRGYAAARQLIEAVILSSAGIYSATGSREAKGDHNQALRPVRPRETRTAGTTGVSSSCPIPIQDALSNLISSLFTALCGMCIARSQVPDSVENSAGLKTREMVSDLAFTVQRAIGNEPVAVDLEQPTFHPLRRSYALLADCTLHCGKSVTPDIIYHSEYVSRRNIESFFKALAPRQEVVKELARLVSQVFHLSGHTQEQGPARTPREIRAKVSQLAQLTSATGVALLLGKVATETAMELAERSLDPDDHTWAVEIQETVASSQEGEASQQSPSSSQLYASLYRWEDSIGEWVARTPAARSRAVTTAVPARAQVRKRGRPRVIACSTDSSSASSICSEENVSSVTSSAPSPQPQVPAATKPRVRRRGRPRLVARSASSSRASSMSSEESVSSDDYEESTFALAAKPQMRRRGRPRRTAPLTNGSRASSVFSEKSVSSNTTSSSEKPVSVPVVEPQVRRRGRPRLSARSTNISAAESSPEKSISSVTSSSPSVSRKRPSANQGSSPRPFKKTYNTRSVERVVGEDGDSANRLDSSSYQASSVTTHVPVAARTRTGLRGALQKNSVGQGNSMARNVPAGPVPGCPALEVVVVNKSPSSDHIATSRNHIRPMKRRARYSTIIPRKSPRLFRRRQSAPARFTRTSLRTTIPCSEDDSDDELSFL
ncbi:uncharacterized protein DSM5745_02988 [Aspergillus mulundensis]|uniref:Uncharacterized protein n=1 Tax=Aspergillus mulundensis TaxID=1810919 RepID=A0A3D8SJ85_9EURO|nr:Uncharacterized protein DSM5745_02988 [Aspergillus mulundensis]RDW86346.1 Uncharacterized protein DSM5745_02988 [Aspergillus mulundensis]